MYEYDILIAANVDIATAGLHRSGTNPTRADSAAQPADCHTGCSRDRSTATEHTQPTGPYYTKPILIMM